MNPTKLKTLKTLLSILTFAALLPVSGCTHNPPAHPPSSVDFTITGHWTEDFTNNQACSSTVTTGCISGFQWGYLQGTTQVPLKSSSTSVCTGTTQPEPCTDTTNSQLPIGNLTFYVVATYVNNAGTAGTTASDTTASPVTVSAPAPSALSVTVQ